MGLNVKRVPVITSTHTLSQQLRAGNNYNVVIRLEIFKWSQKKGPKSTLRSTQAVLNDVKKEKKKGKKVVVGEEDGLYPSDFGLIFTSSSQIGHRISTVLGPLQGSQFMIPPRQCGTSRFLTPEKRDSSKQSSMTFFLFFFK